MEFMIAKLLGFVMVLTRVSAFFIVCPVFSWKSLPKRIKVAMAMLLSIFFSAMVPSVVNDEKISTIKAILLISNEAIYGLALGLIAVLVFSAVKFGGRIIERQMGLAMANTFDPLSGERSQPLGMLIEMIFVILFFSANGHYLLLMMISKSYEAFPAGTMPDLSNLLNGIVEAGSVLMIAGLRLAAPMLAAFLVLMVVLAFLARLAPEMNILFVSMPVRVGLGLIMVGIFLPFINGFVSEFANWMNKLLPL